MGFKTSCPDYNHVGPMMHLVEGSWERLKPVTARSGDPDSDHQHV